MAAAQGLIAIFERHFPKVSPVRVAAIRRTASMYGPGAGAGLWESSVTELCDVLNFSCRYHPTAPRCSGKTMFLFSACSTGMPLMASKSPPPATIISVVFISLLTPNVLALANRIEDAIPSVCGIEDRHAEDKHRIVLASAAPKPMP
jgi:hypothetical protein